MCFLVSWDMGNRGGKILPHKTTRKKIDISRHSYPLVEYDFKDRTGN